MRSDMKTQLLLEALSMAIKARKPQPGLIHHSDRGVRYASYLFQEAIPNRRPHVRHNVGEDQTQDEKYVLNIGRPVCTCIFAVTFMRYAREGILPVCHTRRFCRPF